jgi:pimeloyl-ACP methyl ester carboxylesterase
LILFRYRTMKSIILSDRSTIPRIFFVPPHLRLDRALPDTSHPLLLALPGAGCSPAIYDAVVVPGWAVAGVDWSCGEGLDPPSVAQRLHARIEAHRGPIALAGHSAGAAIAALTAAMAGPRVAALVLSNTGVHSRNHGDPTLVQRIRNRWGAPEQEAFLRSCFHHAPPEPLWATLCEYLAVLPVDGLLEAIEGLRALDLTQHLGSIRVPTLIAHGRYDTRRRVTDAEALAAGIPRATLALLPGGHTPMVDCQAEYCGALTGFLRAVQPAPLR